jgi:hypothetical protein
MVFDPYTDYGRDLFIEFETEPLRSVKEYKRQLEVTMGMDHWVRQEDRLYDPKSLRVTSSIDGHEVIAFRYDRHERHAQAGHVEFWLPLVVYAINRG